MLCQIRKRHFNSMTTFFRRCLRNRRIHGTHRRIAQNARRLAIFVAVDVPALNIFAGQSHAR